MKITLDSMVDMLVEEPRLHKVTRYISPHYVEKATRRGRPGKNRITVQETYLITIGKPNYAEKRQIKLYREVKEPFPVKRLQLKWYPVRA
jgi:hypothetical protein